MPYTPGTPRVETIPTTTSANVTQYEILEFVLDMRGSHPRLTGVIKKTMSAGPDHELPFSIQDVDGNTPIANRWATMCTAANSRYDEIKDAIYDLLANVNDPETGQPYVPAGTVS